MSNSIFYTIGIAFMSGIFIRSFLNFDLYGIATFFFVGTSLIVATKIIKTNSQSFIFLLGIACIFISLGMTRLNFEEVKNPLLQKYESEEVELIGRVVKEPEQRETTMHFYVKAQSKGVEINETILVTSERFQAMQENILYGDIVSVTGTLTKPEAFESNGGREFDYPGYLKTRGVTYTISYGKIELEEKGRSTLLSNIYHGKAVFQNALEQILPMPHAGLGEGVLLGVKRALGSELEEIFRKTGIIHIVVLSGYNVMIVVEALMFILAYFFLPKMRMVLGLMAIILFVLLVGPSATVLRASFMAGLLIIARTTGRVYAILRALVLAGLVMLLINPYLLIHDPGFQLSFLATLALILFAPYVENWLLVIPETFGIRKIVTATLATQVVVLPLLLYHMGLLSLVSVLVNVLVLPMVPIAMLLMFLTGMLGMFVEPLGILVGFVSYYSLGYIIGVSEFFGSLPFAAVSVSKFPAWVMFLTYGVMVFWFIKISKQKDTFENSKNILVEKDFSDWTIEEETEIEKTDDAQSAPPAGSLPFR